ncbi:interferon gamma isoform X1 [Stigmatopora nigra]
MRGVAAARHRHRGRHPDQSSGGPASGATDHRTRRIYWKMAARAMLLGLCLLCLCLCGVQNAPSTLNRTVQNLLQIYKIPPKERFNGRPLFSRELLSTKMEAKDVLMSALLQTYEELLGRMIRRAPAPTPTVAPAAPVSRDRALPSADTRSQLNYLLKRVRNLRKYRYRAAEPLLRGLDQIRCVQVDDLVVQSKALWQLPSLLRDDRKLRRRRRA